MLHMYSFATPTSSGSGSLAAATAAVIADLEPWSFYEVNGSPMTTPEVAEQLNDRVECESIGMDVYAVRFSRTFDSVSDDEFRIEQL